MAKQALQTTYLSDRVAMTSTQTQLFITLSTLEHDCSHMAQVCCRHKNGSELSPLGPRVDPLQRGRYSATRNPLSARRQCLGFHIQPNNLIREERNDLQGSYPPLRSLRRIGPRSRRHCLAMFGFELQACHLDGQLQNVV